MHNKVKSYLIPGRPNIAAIYVCSIFMLLSMWPYLIGITFAFAYQDNRDPVLSSHYVFAFRTMLIGIIGFIIAKLTILLFMYPLFVLVCSRSVIALKMLINNVVHPNPLTFLIK